MLKYFKSVDRINLAGLGLCFFVIIPEDKDLPQIAETINIDGVTYVVNAIERAKKPMSPPIRSNSVLIGVSLC